MGPNGHGKTTLLRHIGSRALQIPPNIDVLYCEQEVVANEMSALETVLASDEKRTELMKECEQLEKSGKDPDKLTKVKNINVYVAPCITSVDSLNRFMTN